MVANIVEEAIKESISLSMKCPMKEKDLKLAVKKSRSLDRMVNGVLSKRLRSQQNNKTTSLVQ
jgi:hypothetical protein